MAKKKKYYQNKYGAKIDLDLIRLGKKYATKVNEQRAKERERILNKKYVRADKYKGYVEMTVGEVSSLLANKYMGETPYQDLNSVNFNPETLRSNAQAKRKLETLRRMGTKKYKNYRNKIYKNNILRAMDTKFGNIGDPEFLAQLKMKIRRMSAQELAEFAYTTEALDLDFVYETPDEPHAMYQYFNKFADAVNEVYNEKYHANER